MPTPRFADSLISVEEIESGNLNNNSLLSPDDIKENEKINAENAQATAALENSGAQQLANFEEDAGPGGGMVDPLYGTTIKNVDYESYNQYIDRPFSFIADDADDLRAQGQTTGEKLGYGALKLIGKVGTNVVGSTVGLGYGGYNFMTSLFSDKKESATKQFFDNDLQRKLDGINEWMDEKLPHYYTKEEQDYNFFQSMGTANFWANDFSQGLSFVIGAVLSETLTAGLATGRMMQGAKNLLKRGVLKHKGVRPYMVRLKD